MPSADFWDYVAIPHFPGCRRQTFGITQQSLTFQDASGSLLGFRGGIAFAMPPRIPSFQSICPSLLEQADFSFVFPGCRRQTFGITQQSPTCKVPAAACWVFEVILPFGNIGVLESLSYQNLSVQVYLSKQIQVFIFVILIHFYRRSRIPLLYP